MTSLSVSDSCSRCGLCAAACPWRVVALPEAGPPRFTDTGAERCNLCGHCEAVCPSGSLSLDHPRLEPSRYHSGPGEMDQQRLGDYLRMRRSVRSYRQEPVQRDTLEKMMDVVRFAPSGRNRQDVSWLIVHDSGQLRRLTRLAMEWMRQGGAAGTALAARFDVDGMLRRWDNGEDPLCLHAPHLCLACAPRDNAVGRSNALIALAHLDVVAPAFGLGTCWGGIFMLALESCRELQTALELPAGQDAVHCLMLGYPALRYQRPPKRQPAAVMWR